jgi:hypothetical protein
MFGQHCTGVAKRATSFAHREEARANRREQRACARRKSFPPRKQLLKFTNLARNSLKFVLRDGSFAVSKQNPND